MKKGWLLLAFTTIVIGLNGCAGLNGPQTAAVAGVGCWLDECEWLYPAQVSVPDYYNQTTELKPRYLVGRSYSMEQLRCKNNPTLCRYEGPEVQIRERYYSKPYLLSE